MKSKLLTILLVITFLNFALAYEMQEGQNFKAYLCIGKGTTEKSEGSNFIADFDFDCLSELYICWLLGFCGAKLGKDIWGITKIFANKRAVKLMEIPETIEVETTVKNFSNSIASGKLTIYVKNLSTGNEVERKQLDISVNANSENKIISTFTIARNTNTFGDYKEGQSYQIVATLEQLQNDDAKNNTARIDFTVLSKEKVAAVPEINPIVAVLFAIVLLKLIKRR